MTASILTKRFRYTPIVCFQIATIVLFMLTISNTTLAFENQVKKANKEFVAGNFDRAEALYREAISKNPQNVDAHLGLSYLMLKQRNLQEAYNEANKVLDLDPRNARAYAINGKALLRSGYIQRAMEELRIALQLNVRESLALATVAELDLYENRTKNAYENLKAATQIEPQEPDYWLLYARSASRLEQFKEAASALRSFLQYAPKGDVERRERIEGVIKFYNYLGETHIYQVAGRTSTLPMEVVKRRPYIQIKVNGKPNPLRFVLDTGAGVSVISLEAAEKLGLREIARGGNARAVGGEGSFPIIYGLIDEMELGTVKVNSVPVYIRKIHSSTSSDPNETIDGYLGLAVLSNFLFTIDYQKGELSLDNFDMLENKGSLTNIVPNGATVVPFRTTESGLISVEAKVDDDSALNFIFDSGASSSVISSAVVNEKKWNSKILKDVVRVVGAAGVTENVNLMRASKVQLMDLMRENLRMPVLNLNMINEHAGFEQQGILGGDFLYTCRIQINFRSLELSLTPQIKTLTKKVEDTTSKQNATPLTKPEEKPEK